MKVGDIYNFEENENTIISRKEENGYKDQFFLYENIVWRVLDVDKKTEEPTMLIAEKPTQQELTLTGLERLH